MAKRTPTPTPAPTEAPQQQLEVAPPAEVNPITQALTELSANAGKASDLIKKARDLHATYKDVVHDVKTPKGMAAAKKARQAFREDARFPLKQLGGDVSKQMGTMQRQWNQRIEQHIAEIIEYEKPHDEQIKAQETAEANRKAAHELALRNMRTLPTGAIGKPLEEITKVRDDLQAMDMTTWEEYVGEAVETRAVALEALNRLVDQEKLAEEGRQQREKDRLEADRVASIRLKLDGIMVPLDMARDCRTSARLQKLLDLVNATVQSVDDFQEFLPQALQDRQRVIDTLIQLRDAKKSVEDKMALAASLPQVAYPPLTATQATVDGHPVVTVSGGAPGETMPVAVQLPHTGAPAPTATLPHTTGPAPVRHFVHESAAAPVAIQPAPVIGARPMSEEDPFGDMGDAPGWATASAPAAAPASSIADAMDSTPIQPPSMQEILRVLADHYDASVDVVAAWLDGFDAATALAQLDLPEVG